MPVRPPDVAATPFPPPIEARPSSSHVDARGASTVPAFTPSPSSIDARGPSSVPTSTPSPSPVVANMPIDEDATNLAMEDPPSLMIVIWFHPSKVVAKAVTLSIRQQFDQHWPTWGAIPKDHQELFFQRFKSEELGRSVYVDEVFQQTHLRKDIGQFVDDRSRQTHEEFETTLSQVRSDVASSVGESQLTPLDPAEEQRLRSRCWVAAVGPKRKGHLYGTRDLAHTYKCGNDSFMQHTQGSSSRTEDAVETNRLWEELHQSKEEMRVFQSVVL
ncbi:hypothetical protein JHK82_033982 [Glycine max]|nr:hypothetical protein JHK85_034692 [Glycine max]KAG5119562.1 hypothetical protein JHK82_033982 [Glycine max]KAH1188350.1 hypothetical protein GmHk_U059629 [Glycine max]